MRERIEIARARGFSDILTDTFGLFRQNFKPLMGACLAICGLFIAANMVLIYFVSFTHEDTSFGSPIGLFELFIGFVNLVFMIITVQSYFALYKEKGNQPPRLAEVWGYVRYYFFRAFWGHLILLILYLVGSLLCFIPGVYLAVVFSLVAPVMVIENGGFQYSFNRAFQVIKGNWWFSFGLVVIVAAIIFFATFALFIPIIFLVDTGFLVTGKSMEMISLIFVAIIFAASQLFLVLPFTTTTLIYYALTEEKEGTSLLDKISGFGKKDGAGDQLSSEQY